ncbi:hypothetical protein ACTG9Q_27515 [Actinokineospora sp. 24-640]
MNGAIKPAGWSQRQSALLAQRLEDDKKLLEDHAREHGTQGIGKLRAWVTHVRGDLGARGVITGLYFTPDGSPGAYYLVDDDPDPDPAPATAAALPGTRSGVDLSRLTGGSARPAGTARTLGSPASAPSRSRERATDTGWA